MAKEGVADFSFKLHGHKHTFQASNGPERDSWIVAVEAKAVDAKASLDEIKNTEGYKSSKKTFGELMTETLTLSVTNIFPFQQDQLLPLEARLLLPSLL